MAATIACRWDSILLICVLLGTCNLQASASLHLNQTVPLLSLEAHLSEACEAAKPTVILISGVGGSQLSGVSKGSKDCEGFSNTTVLWFADHWLWKKHMRCWAQHMSLQFDKVNGRWRNATGTQIWPDYGSVFGAFPENSKQKLFYAFLLRHMFKQHGYIPGVNFFIIPFDWRTGIQGLEQDGGLQRITDDITRATKINCGKKAIVMSHSYGANVMATVFQKPQFAEWRQKTVSGWIPVGGAFGGAAATPWLTMLAGDFFKLLPWASNFIRPETSGKWHPTVIGKSIYNFAFGLPSWGWMLPREGVLGLNQVVVSTPTKNYTAMEQKQLLLDMGDSAGAALLDDSWQRSEELLQHGPVAGLDTYCLYSTDMPTPTTLMFNETVKPHTAMARPYDILWTAGDGVVDLNSLRLCKKLTTPERVVEVNFPLVDHASILSHPLGLHALDSILYKLGVPRDNPLAQLVKKLVVP